MARAEALVVGDGDVAGAGDQADRRAAGVEEIVLDADGAGRADAGVACDFNAVEINKALLDQERGAAAGRR